MVESEYAGSGEAMEGRQVNARKEEHAALNERAKPNALEGGGGGDEEAGPLGLRLTISPSLIHLIETRLSQESSGTASMAPRNKKEKKRAPNFAMSLLRIGCWECVPKHENSLVAKFYLASRKLVWEVLDGALKNKIEIRWSDIMDIKARFPDDGPGTLNVILAKQPHFFREKDPVPGKQSVWKPTSDFTGGQASIYRTHFIQCPQGVMDSHFYNLVKCNHRLNSLSCRPEIRLESPFFETSESVSGFSQHARPLFVGQTKEEDLSTFSGDFDLVLPPSPCPTRPIFEAAETPQKALFREAAIPHIDPCNGDANQGVIPADIQEKSSNSCWNSFIIEGLHPSMALDDLMIHIRRCIYRQMTAEKAAISPETHEGHYQLNDSEFPAGIDSLYSLNGRDAGLVEAPQVESWDGTNGLPHPVFTTPSSEEIGGELPGYNGEFAYGGLAYDQQQQPALPNLHKDEYGVNYRLSR